MQTKRRDAAQPSDVNNASADRPCSPRRILLMDHTATLGGGEIALLNLVKELDRRRFTPIVMLGTDGPLAERLHDAGVETHILPLAPSILHTRKDTLTLGALTRAKDAARLVKYVIRTSRFIRKQRIDLVHTNSLKADILGGLASRLARTPVIWHVRDRIEDDYLPRGAVRLFRALCRILPNHVVANSQATLDTIHMQPSSRAGALFEDLTRRRADVVYSGVIHDGVHPDVGAEQSERSPRNGALVGLVGRISPWKGQHIFLEAAAQVREAHPNVRFQIIGSAMFEEHEYEAYIRDLTTFLNLEDCVEFTGFRTDIGAVVANLDVLVHASTMGEPFGQVVAEGMAAGKPVVATRGGGVPEIMLEGVTGLLVPMNDAPAMADALCMVLADPVRAEEMGRQGIRRVRDLFTIQHTARKVEEIYERVLAQRGAARTRAPRSQRTRPQVAAVRTADVHDE